MELLSNRSISDGGTSVSKVVSKIPKSTDYDGCVFTLWPLSGELDELHNIEQEHIKGGMKCERPQL